ncbi:MAG: hypothetical protein ETSY1_11185 [Candidatus Entotheonella factor]|uniref:HTH lysR-type domain-containing protein n=1 Tax=Entotheonella factor TaxID=1429438 RepID=W4LR31_ENTF1|nr:LysR family transcriptional regulator [Candidatus Entotheonella palauensis]ETX00433.1 MAG: hypothetical protein ETSY1_11185 [Candidatus Entotheonella factor]
MNLRNIDLNLLVIFDTLMEERHVTRAGRRVGLSQPAMSSALNRLRQLLQDELLVRTPAGMEPTPRALALASSVRHILRQTEALLDHPADFTPATAHRTFRLRMSDMLLLCLMPPLVQRVGQEAPHVVLDVVPLPPEQTINALEHDEIDMAISTGLTSPSTVKQKRLFDDELVCILRRGHPQAGVPLDLDTFLQLPQIKIAQSPLDMRFVDGQLADQGMARPISLTIQNWLAVPHIVAQTDLLAVLPRRVAAPYVESYQLQVNPVPFGQPDLTWHLYWHKRYQSHAGHRWLRSLIESVATSLSST